MSGNVCNFGFLLTCSSLFSESVKVDLEFKNPLLISTSITSVSLICELTANSDDLKLGKLFLLFDVHFITLFASFSLYMRFLSPHLDFVK